MSGSEQIDRMTTMGALERHASLLRIRYAGARRNLLVSGAASVAVVLISLFTYPILPPPYPVIFLNILMGMVMVNMFVEYTLLQHMLGLVEALQKEQHQQQTAALLQSESTPGPESSTEME
jgi:hypothetical protein